MAKLTTHAKERRRQLLAALRILRNQKNMSMSQLAAAADVEPYQLRDPWIDETSLGKILGALGIASEQEAINEAALPGDRSHSQKISASRNAAYGNIDNGVNL